ncbi:MAG: hypothetical protein Q9165_006461 [Trypethelium subeluteriae]
MPEPSQPPPAGTAEARAAVTASLNSVGANLDADMRARAADLQANANAISRQEGELAKQTAALAKDSAQWQKLVDTSTKKLNEVGDLQNWAEMIERDLLVVEETLRLVDGAPDAENESGTNAAGANGNGAA